MVPKSIVEKWLKHFRNEYPTIAFKCSTSMQRTNLGQSSVPVSSASNGLLNTSDCLGASTLVQLLKNYSRSINIKTAITVGIIGYPNVGKSSLINSLKRSKAVGVGAMPGFTKVMQVSLPPLFFLFLIYYYLLFKFIYCLNLLLFKIYFY